jgi:hypothetical protein
MFPYVRANTVFLRYETKNVCIIRKACLILIHFSCAQHMLPVGTDMRKKWEGRIWVSLRMGLKPMTIWRKMPRARYINSYWARFWRVLPSVFQISYYSVGSVLLFRKNVSHFSHAYHTQNTKRVEPHHYAEKLSHYQQGHLLIEPWVCHIYWSKLHPDRGRAIAEAVSRWLPTAAARVRSRVWSGGICGGRSGAGAGFLRVLRFPLPIFIPPVTSQSPSPIIWGWYNRPEVATVQGT